MGSRAPGRSIVRMLVREHFPVPGRYVLKYPLQPQLDSADLYQSLLLDGSMLAVALSTSLLLFLPPQLCWCCATLPAALRQIPLPVNVMAYTGSSMQTNQTSAKEQSSGQSWGPLTILFKTHCPSLLRWSLTTSTAMPQGTGHAGSWKDLVVCRSLTPFLERSLALHFIALFCAPFVWWLVHSLTH